MKPFVIYLLPAALICMLSACGSHQPEVKKDDPAISDSLFKHVETAAAKMEEPSENIKLKQTKKTHCVPQIMNPIEFLKKWSTSKSTRAGL